MYVGTALNLKVCMISQVFFIKTVHGARFLDLFYLSRENEHPVEPNSSLVLLASTRSFHSSVLVAVMSEVVPKEKLALSCAV